MNFSNEILYEDNHLIVLNKLVGDLAQGDKTGDMPLNDKLKEFIKKRDHKPGNVFLGVPHRLDRPTSGVLVFVKTSKALERLNKLFREKKVAKTYWAVVENTPAKENDTLTHFLKKNPKNNKTTVFKKEIPEGKKAILHYKVIHKLEHYTLLEIQLETGRHHQIRAQLASINCCIKGDLKYGASRSNSNGGIHLHARTICFNHPIGKKEISITAPTPIDSIWTACSTFDNLLKD